jgi:hypothetical protein
LNGRNHRAASSVFIGGRAAPRAVAGPIELSVIESTLAARVRLEVVVKT